MSKLHASAILAIVLGSLTSAFGCGADEWKCNPPSGAIRTTGRFDLDFTGETASFASEAMRVYVTPPSDGTDETIEVWACQERGDEMWTADLIVTRPSTVTTLPASLGAGTSAPSLSAWMTRYDKYQVLDEQLDTGTGELDTFDPIGGALAFDATLTELCPSIVCQAPTRDLVLQADLAWEPR